MWTITNIMGIAIDSPLVYKTEFYSLFADKDILLNSAQDEINWCIAGHVLPRKNVNVKKVDPAGWLSELNANEGFSFINKVKGNFILIQYQKKGFRIFSDRFAIKKFFYWKNDDEFIISDSLKFILNRVKVCPSPVSMAIYALMYHFTGGRTLFNDIFHNEPGQVISHDGRALAFDYYWKPDCLLKIAKRNTEIEEIATELSDIILADLKQTGRERISLSLTGGADTRNLLALFLKAGNSPHLYTYGNPLSADCIKAAAIAKGLKLPHCIHDIILTSDLFEDYGNRIVKSCGGLCSLHRAHRLMAVEKEKEFADYMFLGTLGGEYIKGVSEDDYIVPPVVYNNWNISLKDPVLVDYYFQNRLLINNNNLKEEVFSFLKNEPYLNGNITERKLNALSYITAHLHDAQDINLFCSAMKDIYTPFLDIDYLELVFSSAFTFDGKEKIRGRLNKKLNNPVYGAKFIQATFPELLRYRYSGEHRGDEVLFNKYYASFVKVIRQKLAVKYKANLPLNDWMQKFVEKNLPLCSDFAIIKETFDIEGLIEDLKSNHYTEKESYWLKFTNPIMMRFIIENYSG
jgi:hypothetical protein